MRTSDFKYELPDELIAQAPAPVRSASRMMIVDRSNGAVRHGCVTDLSKFLRSGDLLVLNDTKVFPARIFGRKDTGGLVETLFIEEVEPGIWRALVKTSNPLRDNNFVALGSGLIKIMPYRKLDDGSVLLKVASEEPVLEILEREGIVPLPPYINRPGSDDAALGVIDRDRYQTIYARYTGAVAAPTAGLHFTDQLLSEIKGMGVKKTHVTLHVGPGTFKPVKSRDIAGHRMEEERFVLSADTARMINETKKGGGRVVAVGSTVVRTLESVALMNNGLVAEQTGKTGIFIYPPFEFKVVDAMLTNFHLPESTLIMMVCAFAGYDATMNAYKIAVKERYRFFSYGDCMFIHLTDTK